MEDILRDKEGKIIYFSLEKFREQIIENKSCFICGISKKEADFNDEHIFPKWLLNELKLFKGKIDLPNNETHRYGTYTVPCCVKCNTKMGEEIEMPISNAIRGGYESVCKFTEDEDNVKILYAWLARIFLKTHLKDLTLRKHLDQRRGIGKIGDEYLWEGFYLPFCISRAFYSNTQSLADIMGSFLMVPLSDNKNDLKNVFYYADDTNGLTVLLQIRDIGFVASFGDFGISLNNMKVMFEKIGNNRVNPSQLGQLAAHVAVARRIYKNYPTVMFDIRDNSFISIPPKKTDLNEIVDSDWGGAILYHFTGKWISDERLVSGIKAGTKQFLWNEENEFNRDHL